MWWPEAWLRRRDRWLSNPRFQHWATAFLPTRGLARRRAHALFDLCAGFVYSQVLLACVRLGVLEALRAGPRSLDDVAGAVALEPAAARRLLDAAAALDLVARRRTRAGLSGYGLGGAGAALLGNAAVLAMIEHHPLLYADLADPVALLRGELERTALGDYWAYAQSARPDAVAPEAVRAYSALMSRSQPLVADLVLDAYDVGRHRQLLDLGGGEGGFALSALARAPELRCTVFDLPPVAARARERFAALGLEGRATAVGGDFFAAPLPAGADLISLVRVLHDHDDDAVIGLLRAARAALAPGGRLLIAEPLSTPAAPRVGDTYFGFYLLAMGQGRARSVDELAALLQTAGFSAPRLLETPMPLQASVLVAEPAAGQV